MRYQIRRANKFDFEVVYKLICQLVETEPGTISTKALKDIYLENLHARNKEHYIAEYAGDAVGFISISYDLRLSEVGKVAVIDELVVDINKRKLGIGALLVNHAVQIAKNDGCIMFEVSTNLRRIETHLFYEKIGFTKNGYRFGFDDELKLNKEGIK